MELWQFKKKLTKLKIIWIVAWWGNPRLMIFRLFSILLYVKWSVKSDFPFTFDQTKLTELWQLFCKKKGEIICYNSVNFVRWSKVNGKVVSMDHFTWSSIENNQKIIMQGFLHHASIHIIVNYVNFFNEKTVIIPSILTGGQK